MKKLNRTLTLPFLGLYGIGMILGAGIYSVIGVAAHEAGSSLWLNFLVAGGLAFMTGLSYAELVTLFPKAGAEYVYLKGTFPRVKWLAAAIGLLIAFAAASTASTVAVAFAGYLNAFLKVPVIWAACGLLTLLTLVNVVGIRESSWANAIFTAIEVLGLLLFIGLGFKAGGMAEPLADVQFSLSSISVVGLVIFSYFGFENMVNLAEEAKKPERDVPLAALGSITLATLLYVLVSLALLALIEPAELKGSESPLMDATRRSSPFVASALGVVALFSTANTALIALISGSRLLFSMGRDKEIPEHFSNTLPRRKTPWVGAVAALICAAALVPLGGVKVLASISSFATLIAFLSVHVALITLRYTDPGRKRPFRVPFSVGRFPVFPALGGACTVFLLIRFEASTYVVGIPVVVTACLFTYFRHRAAR